MDEYSTAHLKITHLNMIADGTYMIPSKGEDAERHSFIVIICGNKHPEWVYPNTYPFIEARFNVIEV